MAGAASDSSQIQAVLQRLHAGDLAAREELFRQTGARLERLARKMLRGYPGVHRWAQTDDVLQGALMRMLRALDDVHPPTARDFFTLSAEHIRRELIDLARHYFGPRGLGKKHASQGDRNGAAMAGAEPADWSHEPSALAGWCEFHDQVHRLPADEREVVDLLFYQELPQAEAAALLGVTVRTVQRRWHAALVRLHELLQGRWPGW